MWFFRRWGELSHGVVTLCARSLCASLVIWFISLSLHFVVGVGRVAVGGWYHGAYTLCAAALRPWCGSTSLPHVVG